MAFNDRTITAIVNFVSNLPGSQAHAFHLTAQFRRTASETAELQQPVSPPGIGTNPFKAHEPGSNGWRLRRSHTQASTMNPAIIPASQGDPLDLKRQSDITISSSPGSETASEDGPSTLILNVHSKLDDDELDPTHADEQPPRSPGKVRFRSRVRITSGLNGHRHKARAGEDRPVYSTSSSASCSRSSSLSAPLRNEEEDWAGQRGLGTLGQRVAIMAQSHAQRRQQRALREQEFFAKSTQLGINFTSNEYEADERSPLTKSASYLYMTPDNPNDSNPSVDRGADSLARDIDLVFGPWPTRLWNHHWWWWQIEPILCCHCLTESSENEC